MNKEQNIRIWKVKGMSALRFAFFAFFLGGLSFAYVIYQFGGKSKVRDYLPESVKRALEQMVKREEPTPKASALIEHVDKKFNVTTKHYVSPEALDCVFGGVLCNKGKVFVSAGEKYGISPAFIAAVAIHESDNGKSRYAKELNNPFGAMEQGSTPYVFKSINESINFIAERLANSKYYVRGGNKTIASIQRHYCPVGVENDPKGLNKYWLSGVLTRMNDICKKECELSLRNNPKIASR